MIYPLSILCFLSQSGCRSFLTRFFPDLPTHCLVSVCFLASVSKLGSSYCPPSLWLAWLVAGQLCQGGVLSYHVLTHLRPGLVEDFSPHFFFAEASWSLELGHFINSPVFFLSFFSHDIFLLKMRAQLILSCQQFRESTSREMHQNRI